MRLFLTLDSWNRVYDSDMFLIFVYIAFVLQRVPCLVLTFMILFHSICKWTPTSFGGTSLFSRVLVLIATICNVLNEVPVVYWANVLGECKSSSSSTSNVKLVANCGCWVGWMWFIWLILEPNSHSFCFCVQSLSGMRTKEDGERFIVPPNVL